jgi:hypothetical protein
LKIRGNIFKNTTTLEQNNYEPLVGVKDTDASAHLPLFSTKVSSASTFEAQAAFAPYILTENDFLSLTGDATATAWIYVLEWAP